MQNSFKASNRLQSFKWRIWKLKSLYIAYTVWRSIPHIALKRGYLKAIQKRSKHGYSNLIKAILS